MSKRMIAPASLTGTHKVSRTRKESPTYRIELTQDGRSGCEPGSRQAVRDRQREMSGGSRERFSRDRPRLRIVRSRCRTVRRACRRQEEIPKCESVRVNSGVWADSCAAAQTEAQHHKIKTGNQPCEMAQESAERIDQELGKNSLRPSWERGFGPTGLQSGGSVNIRSRGEF